MILSLKPFILRTRDHCLSCDTGCSDDMGSIITNLILPKLVCLHLESLVRWLGTTSQIDFVFSYTVWTMSNQLGHQKMNIPIKHTNYAQRLYIYTVHGLKRQFIIILIVNIIFLIHFSPNATYELCISITLWCFYLKWLSLKSWDICIFYLSSRFL